MRVAATMDDNGQARITELRIEALAVGFILALFLMLLTVGTAAFAVTRVQYQTLDLAQDSEESTYYLGNVGGQLALMHGYVALASRVSDAELPELERRFATTDAALQSSLVHIPHTLDAESRRTWDELWPDIARLRTLLQRAFESAMSGDDVGDEASMNERLVEESGVYDRLEQLERAHRSATVEALQSAHQSTFRVRVLEGALGAVLLCGTIAIWLVVIRALRRQQRLIAEHVRHIEAMNEDLDAFAGRVAHDLRNALSPLVTSAAVLRESGADARSVASIGARIERSTARAVALVDGLLAFSRAARSMTEDGETASVREAVDEAVHEVQPLRTSVGADVDVDLGGDCRVRVKQGLLSVVLTNLCSNALKFLEGCPERRVRVGSRNDGPWCVIEVEDTGPGIPEAVHGRIFEPFFRVPGARATGSGIGLATVARIVDRCGGRIHVRSAPGEGACFEVRLPRAS